MISHNKPTLGQREVIAAKRVINSGWVAQGREVVAFEDEISDFFGLDSRSAVVVSSGTSALFLALWVLQSKGSRVGVPVYSCSALRNAVEMAGAIPIYIDCKEDSPNIDLNAEQVSMIDILISPSMYGIPIDVQSNRSYKVIEDLAQAFGAKENGERIGLRGEIGICSFYATKIITSGGQGGVVFSNDINLIDEIKDYREFDNRRDEKIRFNFQMTDVQAAIGREQLSQFSTFNQKRDEIFSIYKSAGLNLLDCNNTKNTPVRYRAVLRVKKPKIIINRLKTYGVRAIVPIELDELLDDSISYKNAEYISRHTVSLPIYPDLDNNIAKKISQVVTDIKQ
jgi:perosamine synthetase